MCVLPRLRPRRPNFALPACSASASLTLPCPPATRRQSLWSTARRPRMSHGRATPTRRSRRRSRRVLCLFALRTAPRPPIATWPSQAPDNRVRVEHRLLTRAIAAFSFAGGVPHGEHWQGCVSVTFSCASAHLLTDLRVQPSTLERNLSECMHVSLDGRVLSWGRAGLGGRSWSWSSSVCKAVLGLLYGLPRCAHENWGGREEVESTFADRPAPAFRSPSLLVSSSLSSSARPCFRALASSLHPLPRVGCTAVKAVPLRLSPFLA